MKSRAHVRKGTASRTTSISLLPLNPDSLTVLREIFAKVAAVSTLA